jgi:hypothetical protein
LPAKAQQTVVTDSVKRPWLAAAEVAGLNVGLLAFDHYVLDGAYAKVTMHTLTRNLKLQDWWWEHDLPYTNLLEHPYHGSLFYNAARANGMNFWASSAFTIGGSLMWEIAGECEMLSISDMAATSLGGIAIGEVLYRTSGMVLDDGARGSERFGRELAAGLLNPMRGLNRLFTGQAWKVRSGPSRYHDIQAFPVDLTVSTGIRDVHTSGKHKVDMSTAYLSARMDYGDWAEVTHNRPYDQFEARVRMVVGDHQNLFNEASVMGRITARQLQEGKQSATAIGLYQHFNYYYTDKVDEGERPYMVSEVAAVGPGLVWAYESPDERVNIGQGLFADGILMGASPDDYKGRYHSLYSFGSGFGLKYRGWLKMPRRLQLDLLADFYRLYTWIGYEEQGEKGVFSEKGAQGDVGNVSMLVLRPTLNVNLYKNLGVQVSAAYYHRNRHYKHHEDVKAHTWELTAGLVGCF